MNESDATLARALATTAIVSAAADNTEAPMEVRRALLELANRIAARPLYHVIQLDRDGFTLMHPLIGRCGDLFDCPVHRACGWDSRPAPTGLYRVELAEDGTVVIGEPWSPEASDAFRDAPP